jgi:hypothetical protein
VVVSVIICSSLFARKVVFDMNSQCEVLQRSTMFIALLNHTCALQRSAMCFGCPSYIPLLKERDRSGTGAINMLLLRSKNPRYR